MWLRDFNYGLGAGAWRAMRIPTFALMFLLLAVIPVHSMESGSVSNEYRLLVPRQLLALLHAPETQQELKLTKQQVIELEALFAEIDALWFPSRIQPLEKQFEIIESLEQKVQDWFDKHTTKQQQVRLRQIELQSQSVRMLLRNDVAAELKLDAKQQQRIAELAKANDEARKLAQQAVSRGEAVVDLQKKVTESAKAEQDAVKKVLSSGQRQQLAGILGESFDLASLKRIYPMAPEFVPVDTWINSTPLTMKGLRGKVVLVHFYAFQCHNCHANFEIYRRWHEQLREKGVVVIGIQTPETAGERDPEAVKTAAAERKLEFPILVDLASENWKAWGNTMWPTVYVVDKNGYLRHWWQGELNWQGATADKTIEQVVEMALKEPYGAK